MLHDGGPTPLAKRQLWGLPTTTTTSSDATGCTPFELPSNGVLSLGTTVVTLTSNALFQPQCTGTSNEGVSLVDGFQDPFYASTIPQTYVIASATVIAWILVVMLIITPRTAFFGSSSAAPTFGNGRGIIGGAQGGNINMIGVGSRPWLQKVAALTVALSLTIATADTFRHARSQYYNGYANADALRTEVLGSLEIRITRVISDVFVWLAQVQTLIRLFPRHKEKVLIKWIGFALIVFDSTFSCLNSFLIGGVGRPRHFVDAIPALSYLFELALGLLYAAWVIYYALTKRRYAFYHKKMRNICLIAFLSLIAVLTPVVFFVTDVSNQDVAGWGDYFRWVGAAAASVVVWEWVERIEALERDEKKDGILGREIFDGDEMLEVSPSEESVWVGSGRRRGGGRSDSSRDGSEGGGAELGLGKLFARFKRQQSVTPETHFPLGRRAQSPTTTTTPQPSQPTTNGSGHVVFANSSARGMYSQTSQTPLLAEPTRPAPVASPISRTDTTSAASTVYVVRYDDGPNAPQPVRRRHLRNADSNKNLTKPKAGEENEKAAKEGYEDEEEKPNRHRNQSRWLGVSNAFKRKRVSPPAEVQQAREAAGVARSVTPAHNYSRWDLKGRLGVLAAETGDKVRDRQAARRKTRPDNVDFPTTVIPAPQRGASRTWSPETLNQEPKAQHQTAPGTPQPGPAALRAEDPSPLGAGGVWTSHNDVINTASPRPRQRTAPPRASDISPGFGNNGGTVVVPAPRRRSPQDQETAFTPTTPSSNGYSNG